MDKVARDVTLQMEFVKIIENPDLLSEAEIGRKQVVFAKELGFNVTKEEIDEFFKDLLEQTSGELSEDELDMVAGGKSLNGEGNVTISIVTFGIGCALHSAMLEGFQSGDCAQSFQ